MVHSPSSSKRALGQTERERETSNRLDSEFLDCVHRDPLFSLRAIQQGEMDKGRNGIHVLAKL